ncbi:hypothetical protein PV327_002775 [Microctonus hyperodae]|uniref:Uncharacterized protein n=1 Tax=Microctonus hyperodae TaxID=165561 RepID=A0AA39FGH7_MICHY|nr:hypothetical protein PV327_002775 [Microctonus hyperodae]
MEPPRGNMAPTKKASQNKRQREHSSLINAGSIKKPSTSTKLPASEIKKINKILGTRIPIVAGSNIQPNITIGRNNSIHSTDKGHMENSTSQTNSANYEAMNTSQIEEKAERITVERHSQDTTEHPPDTMECLSPKSIAESSTLDATSPANSFCSNRFEPLANLTDDSTLPTQQEAAPSKKSIIPIYVMAEGSSLKSMANMLEKQKDLKNKFRLNHPNGNTFITITTSESSYIIENHPEATKQNLSRPRWDPTTGHQKIATQHD